METTTGPVVQVPQLHTLQVTVQALRIGKKQVTQAVFRQLEQRECWDFDHMRLRGAIWGRVNYFWGNCDPNHLHVVWSEGDNLYRHCMYKPRSKVFQAYDEIIENTAAALAVTCEWADDVIGGPRRFHRGVDTVECHGRVVSIEAYRRMLPWLMSDKLEKVRKFAKENRIAIEEEDLESALLDFLKEWEQKKRDSQLEEDEWYKLCTGAYNAAMQAPHLFIAV